MPKVSVIVRSRNDISTIVRTLEALRLQDESDIEILNADCRSTDGTAEVINGFNKPENIVRIEPDDYVPGVVLNRMVKLAQGEFIVFNNSDAIPLSGGLIHDLTAPLADKSVCATFANQIPRPDAWPLVRKDYERAFGDGSISQNWKNFFSLVSSAMRKETLLKHPFREDIQYSEDVAWAWERRCAGEKIVYVPSAKVEHSHNYTLRQTAKRFLNEGLADTVIYGGGFSVLRGGLLPMVMEWGRDFLYLIRRGKFFWIPFSFLWRTVQRVSYIRGRGRR